MKNNDFKYTNYYDFVIKVLSIAKIGKLFSKDAYALENYDELERISMKMLGHFDELNFEKPNALLRNIYPTPSVSARAIILNEKNEILFVEESEEHLYGLPGGWCDLYDSPREAITNEIMQEAGAEVKDIELIGVINQTPYKKISPRSQKTFDVVPEYALIFKAKFVKLIKEHTHETCDVKFFDKDHLPNLSHKINPENYRRIIEAALNNKMILD